MNHSSHLSACDLSHFLKTKLKLEDQWFDSREAVEHPSQRDEYKNTQQDCRKQFTLRGRADVQRSLPAHGVNLDETGGWVQTRAVILVLRILAADAMSGRVLRSYLPA